jgi:hypothetical protein
MPTLNIQFSKFDQYGNSVFVVQEDDPGKKSFEMLTKYHKKLDKQYSTFLPIYATSEYASIRFKKNPKYSKMIPRNIYQVTFVVKRKTTDEKHYINCFLRKLKLISRAPDLDLGEDLDLSD